MTSQADVDTATLRRLARHADTLHEQLNAVLPRLRADADGGGTGRHGTAELASAHALRRVRASWAERLTAVQAECARLRDGFTFAATASDRADERADERAEGSLR
ncbi:type VII secretion target [Streptomyces sp. NBC_01803]|uniref:type VII secretion target n=1 Tax=Streptomyces sp. NBC_01803 TaxID=2975946 RepID=UPI002DD97D86|nr:type VII secretion target [Streptomyces sp. NBC_01803]WSA44894.1 type VII secretion target [Streptomyces sp. NBC_01803]